MYIFTYRTWCFRWWRELFELPIDVWRTMCHCLSYFPVLFKQCRCCDDTTLRILEERFKQHHKAFINARMQHVGHEKDAKRIKACELLLARINMNDYGLDLPDNLKATRLRNKYQPRLYTLKECYSDYMEKQDWNLLLKMLGKYMRQWWI